MSLVYKYKIWHTQYLIINKKTLYLYHKIIIITYRIIYNKSWRKYKNVIYII